MMQRKASLFAFILISLFQCYRAFNPGDPLAGRAFRRPSLGSIRYSFDYERHILANWKNFSNGAHSRCTTKTAVHAIAVPSVASASIQSIQTILTRLASSSSLISGSPIRLVATILATALVANLIYKHRLKLLWPGIKLDASISEPLPPKVLGCPWLGINLIGGSRALGPEYIFRKVSQQLDDAPVYTTYFMGTPFVAVSGMDRLQYVNSLEFSKTTPLTSDRNNSDEEDPKKRRPVIVGTKNVLFEKDKKKHAFLRKLIGSAMTPQALSQSVPILQRTAEETIDRGLIQRIIRNSGDGEQSPTIKMEDICVDYTMDITQKQLLGLQLDPDEVTVFRSKLKVWLKGLYSFLTIFNIPWIVRRSPYYQARLYIQSKIEEKVDSLLEKGPDVSTLSNMLFAADEENEGSNKKLSRNEVVENALLLIVAGSETSAGILTLSMLLLGLHPEIFRKVVQEQKRIVAKYGVHLTQEALDSEECPYLDAVLKEALRIGPPSGNFAKKALDTLVVDGMQVPKGWTLFSAYRLTHQLDPKIRQPDDKHMDVYEGFKPERWFDPETTPSAFVPFGVGPRFCLGYNLAMLEMKVFLAVFARRASSFCLEGYKAGGKAETVSVKWNPATIIPRPSDGVVLKSLSTTAEISEVQSKT